MAESVRDLLEYLRSTMPDAPPDEYRRPASYLPDDAATKILAALAKQESGNGANVNHALIKSGTHKGDRAMGVYGVMPKTLEAMFDSEDFRVRSKLEGPKSIPAATTKEGLKKAFLENRDFQDFVVRELLDRNAREMRTKDPEALAIAHYAGSGAGRKFLREGAASDRQVMTTGRAAPSVSEYARSVLELMER